MILSDYYYPPKLDIFIICVLFNLYLLINIEKYLNIIQDTFDLQNYRKKTQELYKNSFYNII